MPRQSIDALSSQHADLQASPQGSYNDNPPACEKLSHLAADGQGVTALGSPCGKHLTTVLGGHTLPETMLVPSLPVMGLKRPFHCRKLL